MVLCLGSDELASGEGIRALKRWRRGVFPIIGGLMLIVAIVGCQIPGSYDGVEGRLAQTGVVQTDDSLPDADADETTSGDEPAADGVQQQEDEAKVRAEGEEKARIEAEERARARAEAEAAEEAAKSTQSSHTVYVTNTGSKYHSAGCRHLKKSKIEIGYDEARSQGYEPCGVCNPG